MAVYLEALHKTRQPVTTMGYDEVIARAELAASFVQHPYWTIMSRSMSGTIQAETEQLLATDDHKDVNRASVAMCRKYLQMPYFDIEQGKVADAEYRRVQNHLSRRRTNQSGSIPHEVQ